MHAVCERDTDSACFWSSFMDYVIVVGLRRAVYRYSGYRIEPAISSQYEAWERIRYVRALLELKTVASDRIMTLYHNWKQ